MFYEYTASEVKHIFCMSDCRTIHGNLGISHLSEFLSCNIIFLQIFCVHGGIPSPDNAGGYIEEIKHIPKPLPDPEQQSPLAWEILWSDPIRLGTGI